MRASTGICDAFPEDAPPFSFANHLPALLVLLRDVEAGIFTRITMTSLTSTWHNVIRLSNFEVMLVCLVVLEIFVMRYYLILPLDISKLISDGTLLATAVSRKKRQTYVEMIEKERLANTMFTILRRLDREDCFLRTLCELQARSSQQGHRFPVNISNTLTALHRSGLKRQRMESTGTQNNVTLIERPVISVLEEAVMLGHEPTETESSSSSCRSHNTNNTTEDETFLLQCQLRYSLCPLTSKEILDYITQFQLHVF